jgi:hypothetical protein
MAGMYSAASRVHHPRVAVDDTIHFLVKFREQAAVEALRIVSRPVAPTNIALAAGSSEPIRSANSTVTCLRSPSSADFDCRI